MQTIEEAIGEVLYCREDAVARIVLNRPHRLNAINDQLTLDLSEAFHRFDMDDEAKVAIIHGAGRAFSSGGDVKDRQSLPREVLARQGGPQGRGVGMDRLLTDSVNWKPIIAACHGYVFGAALIFAFECDLSVASAETVFEVTEVKRGLAPGRMWGSMFARGAVAFASDVSLTGRRFTAQEAYAAGLVNRVVETGQHLAAATELALAVAELPPLGVRAMVRETRLVINSIAREMHQRVEPYRLYLTSDFQESVAAHLEKRPPKYRGE